MSLKIVLLTREGRSAGAQMAWRLIQNGFAPSAVFIERRSRLAGKNRGSLFSLFMSWGFAYTARKIFETLEIKIHYYLRKILRDRFKASSYLSIEELALDYPINLYEVDDHNSLDTIRHIEAFRPDVGVLVNTRRLCSQLIAVPGHGFLNLHLSALPKYGGLEPVFWALYHGEKEIGVTVHFVSEKIDEGDIVLQNMIPVSRLDDEDSLYTKALWLGTAMMVKALKQLDSSTIQRRPQNHAEASYFSWPIREERAILNRLRKIERIKQWGGGNRRGILHVITRMTCGGAQENTLATVRGLREKGYGVTLLTGPAWGKEGEILSQAIEEKNDVVVLPGLVREINLLLDFYIFIKLWMLLLQNRYVMIHTHTSKAGFLGRLAAFLSRIPVVVHTPHGHVFHSYFSKWKERFFVRLERWMARWTDALIALTDACRREHLDLRIGSPEQWVVIPSGVDRNTFVEIDEGLKQKIKSDCGIPKDRKIIGFIGRLSEIKGPGYLVEAIPEIRREIPDSHFLFVGDGRERESLEARAEELGISSSVSFLGHRDNPSEFLSLMNVLVVPSLNEGMGRVIVEGGLLKKPVVGTRVGGIPDLLENEAGLLTEPRNVEEIARAVVRFIRDKSFAAEAGTRLYNKVSEEFTEERMIEKIEGLYRHLLTEHKLLDAVVLR